MQITTTLTNAQPRVVNKRDGSGSFTLYELFDHEGTAWVVKQDVFNQWSRALGQPVDMQVRVEQNGSYTNRYADFISPSMGGAGVPPSNAANIALQQAQAAAIAAQRVAPVVPTMTMQPNTIGGMGQPALTQSPQIQDVSVFPTRKDAAIHRQAAAKVAALISKDASEFWSNVVDLARYFDSGQTPMQTLAQPVNQAMPATSPTESGTGYDNSPPPYGDMDVPF